MFYHYNDNFMKAIVSTSDIWFLFSSEFWKSQKKCVCIKNAFNKKLFFYHYPHQKAMKSDKAKT